MLYLKRLGWNKVWGIYQSIKETKTYAEAFIHSL